MYKYTIGFTQGTFDMFHIGHLNLLRNAKAHCKKLIVGVNTDELVFQYKSKHPVIGEVERSEILRELRCVDEVVLCTTLDKKDAWNRFHFDAIFIGDDWKGNERWLQTEQSLNPLGAKVIYLKYTEGISSTILRPKENLKIEG